MFWILSIQCQERGGVSGKPTAATWPWFDFMDGVLEQGPSVLISSIREETPGTSTAMGEIQELESAGR